MTTNNHSEEITIKEEENDFPLQTVSFVRIGSAHAEASPEIEKSLQQFLYRVRDDVAVIYEPEAIGQDVEIKRMY
ncbi:hypothetical protein [Rubinisphaera italica]|uniref:Uncharacterized protein n=1 Tax=Rubinisphaera italica TaxID=2527969 RepID=A0A5C5XMZ8_9PLAN|nr:hypothetical protein [Rubinisphaera italica]TWT63743.1 hypothetical protein Pan54_45010 [Rubinisphaera italica]